MNLGYLLEALEARLPELEWQMNSLVILLSEHSLPKGLFRSKFNFEPSFYIAEVKADIKTLASEGSLLAAEFLAKRIHQKINVLIAVCKTRQQDSNVERPLRAVMSMIHTRKEWVESLEKEIANLSIQQQALHNTHQKLQQKGEITAMVAIQKDLGAINRQITLAQERLITL